MRSSLLTIWVLLTLTAIAQDNPQEADAKSNPSAAVVAKNSDTTLVDNLNPTKKPALPSASAPIDNNKNLISDVSNSEAIQKEVVATLAEMRSFLKSKQESPPLLDKLLTLLGSIAAIVATSLGSYISYIGLSKIPFFEKNKGLLVGILGSIALLIGLYIISGIIISVVYVFVATLILILAIIVFGTQLIGIIDEKYPEFKENLLNSAIGGGYDTSLKSLAKKNIASLEDWLSNVVFIQQIGDETTLELVGSLVEGFSTTKFSITPDARISAHWKNIDGRMLIPVAAKLEVLNPETERVAEVLNFQMGIVVIKEDNEIKFERFNINGYAILGEALLQRHIEKHSKLIEEQEKLRVNFNLNESQSI